MQQRQIQSPTTSRKDKEHKTKKDQTNTTTILSNPKNSTITNKQTLKPNSKVLIQSTQWSNPKITEKEKFSETKPMLYSPHSKYP